MALNPSNSSSLEQVAFTELSSTLVNSARHDDHPGVDDFSERCESGVAQ